MAVGYDNTGSGSSTTTGAASLTWTHNIAAAATLLLVAVSMDNLSAAPQASWCTCTAGGVSMTQATSSPVNNGNGSGLWVFYLFNPPTGSSVSIVATNAGGSNTNGIDAIIGDSMSFTAASTLGTPVVITSGSGATATVTVSGVAATSMVAAFLSAGDNISAPTTGTSRVITNVKGSGGNTDGNQAAATNTGSGSVSVTWGSLGSGDTHAAWGVEIKAAAAATVTVPEVAGRRIRPARIPPRSNIAHIPAGGRSQPPIPPSALHDQRRPRIPPPRGIVVSGAEKGISQPPIPPAAVRASHVRQVKIPPRGSSPSGFERGIFQPPHPPGAVRDARRPKLPPRGSAMSPPSAGFTPAVAPRAPQPAQVREWLLRFRRGAAAQWHQGIAQPPIPPQAIRDARRPRLLPPRSAVAQWARGIPQPPIPPQAVRNTRRPEPAPRHGIAAAPPPPRGPVPAAVARGRRLIRRIAARAVSVFTSAAAPVQPEQGTVDITLGLAASVAIDNIAATASISNTAASVAISNTAAAVTISNIEAGTVTIVNDI